MYIFFFASCATWYLQFLDKKETNVWWNNEMHRHVLVVTIILQVLSCNHIQTIQQWSTNISRWHNWYHNIKPLSMIFMVIGRIRHISNFPLVNIYVNWKNIKGLLSFPLLTPTPTSFPLSLSTFLSFSVNTASWGERLLLIWKSSLCGFTHIIHMRRYGNVDFL